MNIKSYGWDEHFEREWNQKCTYDMFPGLVAGEICCSPMQPGRIVADYGQMLRVAADAGLERYLIAAWESGAVPVVVLTKADCCDDVADRVTAVYATCPGVEVHSISCVTGEGHTTTHRELLLLPEGGLILDTPGMRSLSLWDSDAGMEVMFGDVEELIKLCRFHDCKHRNEPGCAVREAIDTGKLEMKRWESWLKLQKELVHLEAKKEGKLRFQEKQWGKQIAKFQKEFYKERK